MKRLPLSRFRPFLTIHYKGKLALRSPFARTFIFFLGLLSPFAIWPQTTQQNPTATQFTMACPFCGVWAISDESYSSPSVTMVGQYIVITSRQITVPHCPSISYEWENSPRNAISTEARFTLIPQSKARSVNCFVVGEKIEISLTQGPFSNGNLPYAAFAIFPNNKSHEPLRYEGFDAFLIDPERLNGYDDRFSITAIRDQIQRELRRCKTHATGSDIENRVDAFCVGEYSDQPYNSSIGASMQACKRQLLKDRLELLQKGNCSQGASLTINESEFIGSSVD